MEPIKPAPRLKSLDGKAIALVGGSFMANVTHPDLKPDVPVVKPLR